MWTVSSKEFGSTRMLNSVKAYSGLRHSSCKLLKQESRDYRDFTFLIQPLGLSLYYIFSFQSIYLEFSDIFGKLRNKCTALKFEVVSILQTSNASIGMGFKSWSSMLNSIINYWAKFKSLCKIFSFTILILSFYKAMQVTHLLNVILRLL